MDFDGTTYSVDTGEIVNGFVFKILIHNKKDSTVVFVDRFSDRKVI